MSEGGKELFCILEGASVKKRGRETKFPKAEVGGGGGCGGGKE